IPLLDKLLDTIAVPASVIAGTILSTSFLELNNPVLRWEMGIIVGGGTAGVVHSGTWLLRFFSSKFTGGLGNPVVSTAENLAAFSISSLAVLVPVIALIFTVVLLVWIIRGFKRLGNRNPHF